MTSTLTIDAGELDRKIYFGTLKQHPDAAGYRNTEEFVPSFWLWGSLTIKSIRRVVENGGDFETIEGRVVVRTPRHELTRAYKLRCGRDVYDILYLSPVGRHGEYTEIAVRLKSLGG